MMSDANSASAAKEPVEAAAANPSSEVGQRRFEFIFAPKFEAGVKPLSANVIGNTLAGLDGVEVKNRISPLNAGVFATIDQAIPGDIVVAEMSWERALELQATAGDRVTMERNWELKHMNALSPPFLMTADMPAVATVPTTSVSVRVVDNIGQPIKRAVVMAFGRNFPVQAETDANGTAALPVYGSSAIGIDAIYVKPFADFWETFIPHPSLSTQGCNTITLQPLSAFKPASFPANPYIGWGQRLLGLSQETAKKYTGRGIKIAIIDSGCDNKHPALTHITKGLDFTKVVDSEPSPTSWCEDTLSHGTHCAGIIAGNGNNAILGFAPEAEVHVLKLFPGGRFDDLISSLRYCIENKISVVNCSLGSDQGSQVVKLWMDSAREAGIAVVVAGGNSGSSVQFPALLPGVMAVSAIGQDGNFPSNTYHQQTEPNQLPGLIGVNGIFAPRFSSFGSQIKLCAPGVAIISSVPGGGYAAWDGTSMAAPHITGLLALVAAHHPAMRDMPRDATWVDRLFEIALASASSVGLDSVHGGAGLPSVDAAFAPRARNAIVPDINSVINAVLARLQVPAAGLEMRSSLL